MNLVKEFSKKNPYKRGLIEDPPLEAQGLEFLDRRLNFSEDNW